MSFRLVPNSVTLDDFERRNSAVLRRVTASKKWRFMIIIIIIIFIRPTSTKPQAWKLIKNV